MRKTRQIRKEPVAADSAPIPAPTADRTAEPDSAPAPSPLERAYRLGAAVHAAPPSEALAASLAARRDAAPRETVERVWAEPEDAGPRPPVPGQAARLRAREVVVESTLISCGLGLLPTPGLDLAGATASATRMLRALARLYGRESVSWTRVAGISLAATLASMGGFGLAANLAGRWVPGLGAALAVFSPLSPGVATYALGMAAIRHFEAAADPEARVPFDALLAAARVGRPEAEAAVHALVRARSPAVAKAKQEIGRFGE